MDRIFSLLERLTSRSFLDMMRTAILYLDIAGRRLRYLPEVWQELKIPGQIRILRPLNALVAGLAAVLAFFIASGMLIPDTIVLFAIVFLITAGGNTINDYFDVAIDRINRPDRPLPSGEMGTIQAVFLAAALFSLGILLSVYTNPLCCLITVCNALLLILYAARLKKMIFIGNMAVSYLAASIFLFGGAFYGIEGILILSAIALMTFFAMLSRELLKAAEDVEGDAASGALTFPVEFGVRVTVFLSLLFAICAIVGSFYPVRWWGLSYLAGILIADAVIFIAAIRPMGCRLPDCVRETGASSLLKIGMFSSLIVFTLSAAFL
jgi:geranylgeranylglycerol-phosphate geranylgeranyltransferase